MVSITIPIPKTSYRLVRSASGLDKKQWAVFVQEHPDGNIFQTPQMFDVYAQSEGFTPILIAITDEQEIKGLLVAVIQKENKKVPGIFAKRAVIRGGPLVENQDKQILGLIMKEYERIVKNKVLYSQLRNWADTSHFTPELKHLGYRYTDHLNLLLDLTRPVTDIWKNISRGKRGSIRKAYKENVIVKLERKGASLKNTYNLLKEVYRRVKLPYPDIDFFEKQQQIFNHSPQFLVFSAKWENKVIAFRYVLAFKNVLYISYAGGLKEYYPKCANDLLNWEIFLWGKMNGYTTYDFAGAGSPNEPYGVRVNKMRFGGKPFNLGRYEKIHHPVLYFFANKAFALWQKLLSK